MAAAKTRLPRSGGTGLQMFNSGLEVWLYDNSHREAILKSGAMNFDDGVGRKFKSLTKKGVIVGYSLRQDDPLDLRVYVGDPLSADELSVARWLEPQHALLDLPSGELCVESNDCCRLMEDDPTDAGGRVKVSPGKYRLTLYRIDHEALSREKLKWNGPQEIVVLTPKGKPSDAAGDLLPFKQRRDANWVGKYSFDGKTAQALIWFYDYWDSFVLNLDAAAVKKLGLKHGDYIQTHVPETGHTLVTVFVPSWREGPRFPKPELKPLLEYGFGALTKLGDWDGAEGLFCRRERAKMVVEEKQKKVWLPARVEVLDVAPQKAGGLQGTTCSPTDLSELEPCQPGFLTVLLGDVLSLGGLDELPWPEALKRFDAVFATLDLKPQGDVRWQSSFNGEDLCWDMRLYAGSPETFGVLLTREMSVEFLLLSERTGGNWVATGLSDMLEAIVTALKGQGKNMDCTLLENRDEAFAAMAKAHAARAEKAGPAAAAVTDLDSAVAGFERFMKAVLE